jgi:hypothetical protein
VTTTKTNLTEAALHFVLAASYLAHQPATPESVVAVLAYLGLAALRLANQEQEDQLSGGEPGRELGPPIPPPEARRQSSCGEAVAKRVEEYNMTRKRGTDEEKGT